ncbi:nucleoside deaminase [Cereibacter azotoformans]|uniref:tRNA(Arg) A34 adenosine deaminase TadA n=1 Tax=Cereibacter azotoformans TaxID=43057 RepID=A0A2T5JJW9_9RHOB|nr:nucleoside deaminase [Cereibacter azotoformans]AXQ95524.1 nucleoside deaminase [Cereibacter sphaeroides]PTR06715.1 tRNA(Arg) A34 adenosine deaminase TadA [Cereibacter azotoformans]UIJ32232.1 nucleoside deaminase [Cereibacter azotoformans]
MTGQNEIDSHLMRKLISRARVASGDAGKAGIAAALIRDGQILAEGVNHVHLAPDPTQHAEIVAIGRAAAALGRADLSHCVLMSTLQPCEMCLAAARFAGIRRIVFAARQENVAAKYFAFPHLTLDDFQRAGPDFEAVGGICEAEVLDLYFDGQE